MKKQFILFAICAVAFASCTKDIDELQGGVSGELPEAVEVSLSVGVEGLGAGTEETRSVTRATDDDGISSDIANLLIVQFDGTSDDSRVVATQYVTDNISSTSVYLLPLEAATTIVYLANTFNSSLVSIGTTLAELKAMGSDVSGDTGLFEEDALFYTGSGTKYFRMSGSQDVEIVSGASATNTLSISLKRNVAKVTINLSSGQWGGTIVAMSLKSLPDVSCYYNSYVVSGSTTTEDNYPYNTTVVNAEDENINKTANSINDSYDFYVPVNCRGDVSGAVAQTKPEYASARATYAYIVAKDNNDKIYTYTFYLGANLNDDYNLLPNYHYTYTFNFNGAGTPEVDSRVDELATVIDYTLEGYGSSNCYIINPSSYADRTYYIPIEERINDFWKNYASGSDQKTDIDFSNWSCQMLWYDCDSNPIDDNSVITIEKATQNSKNALKITVPQSYTNHGNIVVAVYDNDTDKNILWSWHLWVTDYNPDSHTHTSISNTAMAYSVDGGDIHRYNGAGWNNDTFTFIMDRNLGARSATLAGHGNAAAGAGVLYYQFGRKDPFPGTTGRFIEGTSYIKGTNQSLYATNDLSGNESNSKSFADVVQDPMTYYYNSSETAMDWCSEGSTTNLWNDQLVVIETDGSGGKSIFDPSPLGWKIATTGVWNGFNSSDSSSGLTSSDQYYYYNFPWISSNYSGRVYKGFAYYFVTGSRTFGLGQTTSQSTISNFWTSRPATNLTGYYWYNSNSLVQNSATGAAGNSTNRMTGYCVRPIKE